ncbi:hypothetical protein [Paenibacillus popilliae]|uniref:Uncharacterized protein n=1 Tax=Paenibacillus popilliae ATCC 14706 TaxID=1212764 RepID=M9M7A2_PAEPP|nr:hypothetical protein [Paenibacillus popilliae]GAC43558.1 hypothetical protein PPOP_2941 [Paenibacillus popilliae ATCC 14706]
MKEILWKSLEKFFKKKATIADKDIYDYFEDIFGEYTGLAIASLLSDRNDDEYLTEDREYFMALRIASISIFIVI